MTLRQLNHIEAREAFHTLLLQRLRDTLPKGTWRLKGGVNLRLFFGSVRYSEDMDFDANSRARDALKREMRKILKDRPFLARLARLGIRDVRQEGRAIHKDTETTLRFKMQLVVQGGISLPTKLETSFRPGCTDDIEIEEPADPAVVGRYLEPAELPLLVPHYPLLPTVRQKLAALALRNQVQARDVFDLFAITKGSTTGVDLPLLRKNLADATLLEARTRALDLPYEAYEGKVLEFLDETVRQAWANRWVEQQIFVADLAEEIMKLPGGLEEPTPDATAYPDDQAAGGTVE